MSLQYTGDHSPLTVAILQGIGEAQIEQGQLDAAAQTITRAKDAARAHSGQKDVLYALSLGLEARLNLARGDRATAQALADSMRRTITALGEAGQPYLPQIQRLQTELESPTRTP